MHANERKLEPVHRLSGSARLTALLGAQIGSGVVLHWLTTAALDQSRTALLDGHSPPGGWTLDSVIVDAAACVAWIALVMLVLTTATAVLVTATPRRVGRGRGPAAQRLRGPSWWRRWVLCLCGVGLAAPLAAGPSLAADAPSEHSCAHPNPVDVGPSTPPLSGLRLPDLPESPPQGRSTDETQIVQPADSLWSIARAQLRRSASDADVWRRVNALYAANRAAIGPDPDLILPGTELISPGGTP